MREEYVIVAVLDPGSHDKLVALDIAQPSRQPFPSFVTKACILHGNGNDSGKELDEEHRQAQKDKEEEDACASTATRQ